jgi:glycosyltransferase involved in cell wall biosynthesis
MRLLIIEPDLSENGALRVTLDRAGRWQEAGADVTLLVLYTVPWDVQAQVPVGVRVVQGARRRMRRRWQILPALVRAVRLARRADVVVAGREIDHGLLAAAAAARVSGRPLAVTVQSHVGRALVQYVPRVLHGVTVRALRQARLVVPVSHDLVPSLMEVGIVGERVRPVPNGIDVAAVRRAAEEEPAMPIAGSVVVATGRVTPQKGFDLLIRAHAKALAAGAPPHRVLILGRGLGDDYERLADACGVGDSVTFTGFVDNPHATVARADLFVLSSRWEGYSLALAEALCCATPCIAFDCPAGPREVLDDGRYGVLVPPEDVDALAAAIAAHLTRPERLREAAREGAARAAERFDPNVAAAAHLRWLRSLR